MLINNRRGYQLPRCVLDRSKADEPEEERNRVLRALAVDFRELNDDRGEVVCSSCSSDEGGDGASEIASGVFPRGQHGPEKPCGEKCNVDAVFLEVHLRSGDLFGVAADP